MNRKLNTAVLALAITLVPVFATAADDAAAGKKVFEAKCASCHGKDGSGDTAMGKKMELKDLRSEAVQKAKDADLITITTKGKGKMPAYETKLSEQEIKNVVAHIRSIATKK